MARLFNATAAQIIKGAETWLWSLGIALLVLSVLLVPTSRLLADDGSGTTVPYNDCKAANGCDTAPTPTCRQTVFTGTCPTGGPGGQGQYLACSQSGACSKCPCNFCQISGQLTYCNCQCQIGTGGCADANTCIAN